MPRRPPPRARAPRPRASGSPMAVVAPPPPRTTLPTGHPPTGRPRRSLRRTALRVLARTRSRLSRPVGDRRAGHPRAVVLGARGDPAPRGPRGPGHPPLPTRGHRRGAVAGRRPLPRGLPGAGEPRLHHGRRSAGRGPERGPARRTGRAGLDVVRLPIRDGQTPTPHQVRRFLERRRAAGGAGVRALWGGGGPYGDDGRGVSRAGRAGVVRRRRSGAISRSDRLRSSRSTTR
jgi:hypothetical protein